MQLVKHLPSTLKNYFISVVVEDVLYTEVHSQFLVLTGGEGKVTAADTANMTYSLDNFLCLGTLPFSEATLTVMSYSQQTRPVRPCLKFHREVFESEKAASSFLKSFSVQ